MLGWMHHMGCGVLGLSWQHGCLAGFHHGRTRCCGAAPAHHGRPQSTASSLLRFPEHSLFAAQSWKVPMPFACHCHQFREGT